MNSHRYEFRFADLARLFGGPLLAMVLVATVLRGGALLGLLPRPWPALDVDHTILTHQAQTSMMNSAADVVLIGDSSCLMDVGGRKLEERLSGSHRVLNLSTTMYVGMEGYAAMLSRYASANPEGCKAVIVLVHPEMLRGTMPNPQDLAFVSDYYAGADYRPPRSLPNQARGLFGLEIFQDRFLSRIPLPLPREFGRFYGFNLDLDRFMTEHGGSANDPNQFKRLSGQGNAEYRLSQVMNGSSKNLRAAIPGGARLVIGVTPIPESFAPAGFASTYQAILGEWGTWIGADVVLSNLPPMLPDSWFASTTHLNLQGCLQYTEVVARHLEPHLRSVEINGPAGP